MLAWQLQCSPVTWPAWGMQSGPVCDAEAAADVDHRDLAHVRERVGGEQLAERLLRADVLGEAVERVRAVRGLDDRLRRHGADPGARPRAQRADREPVRLHGDAELAGRGVAARRLNTSHGASRRR